MIIGCGIDLVNIKRIENIILKWGDNFICKVFTPCEKEYCEGKANKYQSYAGKFAAKEALLKALGIGLRGVKWKEIEIVNDDYGQPSLNLHGKLIKIAFDKRVKSCCLSISHTSEIAIAEVILESSAHK